MDAYAGWTDAERIVVNIASIYRELSGEQEPASVPSQFGLMAEFSRQKSL
jgi:hypothetical protein